jgi:3-deoxy-manno-octulosonate cytidylyltransferase (CMP-KDO synthetase)
MNQIKLFVTDFDGVMTDGKRTFDQEGNHLKSYNIKDGLAIKNIKEKGIVTMILSGDDSNVTKIVGKRLKFDHVITGCENKLNYLSSFLEINKLTWDNITYIGDDLNDIPVLEKVKFRFTPNDCNPQLKLIKDIKVLDKKGGEGCISEIYNLLSGFQKKVCFIPSRYQSSRLPGKPLLKINGKTVIRRVYQQVQKCKLLDDIIVLTDDDRIKEEVESFGGNVGMVTEECLNGTERIVKYIQKNYDCCDLVINVQGDEPYINPENVDRCIQNYIDKRFEIPDMKCSTLHFIHHDYQEIKKRSNGKLILDQKNNIMYCSRNIIPGLKKTEYGEKTTYYGHIGVFVYDKDYLMNQYLDSNTPYQLTEDIEWMKILEDGFRINSVLAENHEIGLDTPDDYQYLVDKYSK